MEVTKASVANALTSAAKDHVIAVTDDIFDESLQKYQSEINRELAAGSADADSVLDLGVVSSANVAFDKAGEPEVVDNPRIRMIHWRTSDSTTDGGRGAGGTIFQVRHNNWFIVQWMLFNGEQRICQARSIVTGGRHAVGPWQELIIPASVAYNAETRQITATGLQPQGNGGAAKTTSILTLPEATATRAGLMAATDKSKLNSLPTSAALQTSLNAKVDKVSGKGLSTFDFNDEQLQKVSNSGLYGRKYGLKYGVRNLFSLTAKSTDAEIRAALTSSDGVRLLETDLTYCAENGCCLFDETTFGHVMVNKATDGTTYNLIEISIPRIGAPGVTSFELPSMRVVTLLSKADDDLPHDQWIPENNIWICIRSLQEKFAYRSELTAIAIKPFIDTWNLYAPLNDARYDPANAPDADHPFYANELWLTYEEALAVHEYGKSNFTLPQQLAINTAHNNSIRTNLLMPMGADGARAANLEKVGYANTTLETLRVSAFTTTNADNAYVGISPINTLYDFCRSCLKLKKIIGVIYLDRLTTSSKYNYSRVFIGCPQLEDFTLIRLNTDLGIPEVPKASLQSIQTLVDYAINTTPITISVHPDVYAKLTGDTSNPAAAALGTKEASQWTTLLQTAAAKQIQFTNTPL